MLNGGITGYTFWIKLQVYHTDNIMSHETVKNGGFLTKTSQDINTYFTIETTKNKPANVTIMIRSDVMERKTNLHFQPHHIIKLEDYSLTGRFMNFVKLFKITQAYQSEFIIYHSYAMAVSKQVRSVHINSNETVKVKWHSFDMNKYRICTNLHNSAKYWL